MAYETIRVDVAENIQTITLHRPEKLNAFTRQMMQELIDAFGVADADDNVRAVIVTGAGRAFCAGADLSGGAGTFERSEATRPLAAAAAGGRPRGLFRRGAARRRRPRHAPHLRVPQARDRRDQWAGGRHRRDHAAADGCTDRRAGGALRFCFCPTRHRDGGRLELVSAAYRRAGAGAGMVFFRTGFSMRTRRCAAASLARLLSLAICCRRRAHWRAKLPITVRQSRSRSRAR